MEGMDPAQANQVLTQLQQLNPELAMRLMEKMSRAKIPLTKQAFDPFKLLAKPPTASNLAGMPSDMEAPWAEKDSVRETVKGLLFEASLKDKASDKNNPGIKGPNENSPNKKYMQ
jgi:hypothetical protein